MSNSFDQGAKAVPWFVPVLIEVLAADPVSAERAAQEKITPGALAMVGVPFTKGENYHAWNQDPKKGC